MTEGIDLVVAAIFGFVLGWVYHWMKEDSKKWKECPKCKGTGVVNIESKPDRKR